MLRFDTKSGEQIAGVLRVLPISAALVAAAIPSFHVAQAQPDLSHMLVVDVPTAHAIVKNGDMLEIGGWTMGSRIDVYLDGPAGVGIGLGSTEVGTDRLDVAMAMRSPDLSASGFEMHWEPKDLSAGHHELWVYSLMNGTWVTQIVPFMTGHYDTFRLEVGNEIRDDRADRD